MATVQFDHRAIAWALALLVPFLWWRRARRRGAAPVPASAATCFSPCRVQIALGIATLLFVVPVPLAAAHQAGAVLVFAAALNIAHALR